MLGVAARHFLQKHHVCANFAHGFAQLGQYKFAIKKSEAFVDIDREHLDREGFGCSGQRLFYLGTHVSVGQWGW